MFKSGVSRNLASLALGLIIYLAALGAFAQNSNTWNQNVSPLPAPTAPVNDYAGVIDDATEAALNKRLIDYQRSTGVELAVATVRTTGDRPIFDYSLAVYRGWGIGAKAGDNPGALLLVAVDDRKYFTQVSADLEDELPDGLVGSLQKQYLVPEFKKGNFGKGISDTINAYIGTIDQRSSGTAVSPTPVDVQGSRSEGTFSTFFCLVIIGIILLIIFANRGGRSGGGRGGWGGGFGGGGSALPWIIGSVISNATSSSSGGGSSSGSDSGWGGSSDWGGGGGGWGGFGGGGDASGGGAGGGW